MIDYDQILDEIAQRIEGLPELKFKTRRICMDLVRFDDFDVANILQELMQGALLHRTGYLEILEAMADFEIVKRYFGSRLANIYECADREGLFLAVEWLVPLPIALPKTKYMSAHKDLQDLTLGERKWVARKAEPILIEKLLVDPDPWVIHNLLRHPRLSEHQVLKICARTPNNPAVLIEVYRNKKWFSRMMVKKALLNNPSTPPRLVMMILPWLSMQDLRQLYKSRRFSQGFIDQIIEYKGYSRRPKTMPDEAFLEEEEDSEEDESRLH